VLAKQELEEKIMVLNVFGFMLLGVVLFVLVTV